MGDYYSVVIFKNTLTQLKKWTSNQLMWFVLIYIEFEKALKAGKPMEDMIEISILGDHR